VHNHEFSFISGRRQGSDDNFIIDLMPMGHGLT
jgi:hypothetical protein